MDVVMHAGPEAGVPLSPRARHARRCGRACVFAVAGLGRVLLQQRAAAERPPPPAAPHLQCVDVEDHQAGGAAAAGGDVGQDPRQRERRRDVALGLHLGDGCASARAVKRRSNGIEQQPERGRW